MEVRKAMMAEDQASQEGEVTEPQEGGDQEKIAIGDTELSIDEAKELVESGKSFKELSEQYPDVDFSELPKAFTQARQELAELKKKPEPENVEPDELKRRKEIDAFMDDPYVKKRFDDLQTQKEQTLMQTLEFRKKLESLEDRYDGSDGRPKFDRLKVLEYGKREEIFNPEVAYEKMHQAELDEWKIKKATEKKRPSTYFEKGSGTGSRQPTPKKVTTFREAEEAFIASMEE